MHMSVLYNFKLNKTMYIRYIAMYWRVFFVCWLILEHVEWTGVSLNLYHGNSGCLFTLVKIKIKMHIISKCRI